MPAAWITNEQAERRNPIELVPIAAPRPAAPHGLEEFIHKLLPGEGTAHRITPGRRQRVVRYRCSRGPALVRALRHDIPIAEGIARMLALLQFDSAALPLINRMLEDGRLPTLASLRRRGTWETIDAQATVLQSSTYPTLCTGIDVREHGLYSAFPWSAADQRARFVQTFPKPRTIWERLTERGRRSLVVDPYLAWAPKEMAGIYLSGIHFEDRMVMQRRSVPNEQRRTLARRHGRSPRLDDVYGARHVASLLSWRDHLIAGPARTASAVIDLLSGQSFELLWLNFSVAHKAGHHLWDPASVVEEPMNSETERRLRDGLAEVYMAIDAAMARVLKALPDDADVIVFSPTGMGPNTSRGDLLPGMLQAVLSGKPRQASSGRGGLRAPVWTLRSSIPASWRSWIARALPDRSSQTSRRGSICAPIGLGRGRSPFLERIRAMCASTCVGENAMGSSILPPRRSSPMPS